LIKVGIIGGGWPGRAHLKGYQAAGGFKVAAVADLIPDRRKAMLALCPGAREFAEAKELLEDFQIDAVSICLPNDLHAPMTIAALKSGKHVICEKPPALNAKEARQVAAAAGKAGKVVLYSVQRRFGGGELAAKQALDKGYAGEAYHVRAAWTRTRGIPIGTGWFTDRARSGGGALIDIGVHMLDLAWHLLGQPKPISVFGLTHQRFAELAPREITYNVDDAAFALLRFEAGKSIELATSWAINQPPSQNGTVCRVYGSRGAVEVYTPKGAIIYRGFTPDGRARETALKPPRAIHHTALMRHFRECILGKAEPTIGPRQGVVLMQMLDAIYRSSETGRSVQL
jgi:predicted dehydrogenase